MEAIQQIKFNTTEQATTCYHCGDDARNSSVYSGDKLFCCNGCKMVYELLESNEMCDYYQYSDTPGISPQEAGTATKFKYLEDESIRSKLVNFSDGETATVTFYTPTMHCSSCVWLLENLARLNPLIYASRVNFLKKEVQITYEETATSLRQMAELLTSLGYEPQINLNSLDEKDSKETDRNLYLKIGVAGFCFVNIMTFQFPEYLSGGKPIEADLKLFFNYLSIFLALPVLLYSSLDYFKSAWSAFRSRVINMDVPISFGVLTLFTRSLYEIFTQTGAGYMDSFTGLIFLLLIGKIFEKKTYDALSFERDYKSYFPVAVSKKEADGETTVALEKLAIGDRIIIRNQELIPADSILIRGQAFIDYSFVTGESTPVEKKSGDLVYAGGRQVGGLLELDVVKDVNQSYLTELWNDETFNKEEHSRLVTIANKVSRYFTGIVLTIAIAAMAFWAGTSWTLALNAFTAVLIIACPCALALSTPFTLGNTLRVFGWNKFYLKNTAVIEALASITDIVFDKTGTITRASQAEIEFIGEDGLSANQKDMIYSLAKQSMHPLSQHLAAYLSGSKIIKSEKFNEETGRGISACINNTEIRLGSATFTGAEIISLKDVQASRVFVKFGDKISGYFLIQNAYRKGLKEVVKSLLNKFKISLLTGDTNAEESRLNDIFGTDSKLYFSQSPFDKLNFVKKLQEKAHKVLMVGDGLNDAGALKQSDAGITLSENINSFSPASDAILDSDNFHRLPDLLKFSRESMRIILVSFIISFIYNVAGLYFAVQGTLSPLIAAVLMPISSISVVVYTTGSVVLVAKKLKFNISRTAGAAV